MSDDEESSPKKAKFSFHPTPKGKQINLPKCKGSIMRAVSYPSGHSKYVDVHHLECLLRHKVDDPYKKGSRLDSIVMKCCIVLQIALHAKHELLLGHTIILLSHPLAQLSNL